MKWDSYLPLWGPAVPSLPLPGSISGPVTTLCKWMSAKGMLGALPTLCLWTQPGHVWKNGVSTCSRCGSIPSRPCFWMRATCQLYQEGFFQTAANKHCNKPMKMIETLFNFKALLGIINNGANRDLVEETIIFCSDFSWVFDKVVPMTIAAGNAAWTEHTLQQSVNIFVPHITDNKANREIILSVFLFTWWERVSVCHTMEWV